MTADTNLTATALPSPPGDVFDDRSAEIWSWRWVMLGIAIRLLRYLAVMPLWQDEQLVALNISLRDYAGLLQPLDLKQVAPIGYLLSEKWLTTIFGFNEYSLRAVALVCGCGGLVLFRSLAAQLLRGTALVAAVAMISIAYFPFRHAVEVKPYACDLFFAVLMLRLALAWFRQPTQLGPPAALSLATIAALTFSFPAIFVAGGISVAMLSTVWRRRDTRLFATFAIYNLITLAVFGGLLRLAVSKQFDAATQTDFMYDYWVGAFPPSWKEPWLWPIWLVEVHCGEGLAYPIGSKRFGSIASTIIAIVGVITFWRNRRTWLPHATAATFGLAMIAAALGRYPYGHGERLQQYWAPYVCCFLGAGLAALLARIKFEPRRRLVTYGSFTVLFVLGLTWGVTTLLWPYKNRGDREHQAFSRWYWQFAGDGTPQVCITEDLGRPFITVDRQKSYLVYQDINRRAAPTQRERLAAVPSGATLECVAFEVEMFPRDEDAVDDWLRAMKKQYRLVAERSYPIWIDDRPLKKCAYRVWRWEPLSPKSRPESAANFEPVPID